jgi:hypothetical protein
VNTVTEQEMRVLIRNLVIELVVYGVLVVTYSIVVLRLLSEPLARLFHSNLATYAFVALGLIVAQGALLDTITSFLLRWLHLE